MNYIAQHWPSMLFLLIPPLLIAALIGNAWHILHVNDIDPLDAELQ